VKIGIMQPYFFPYIGYFQLINAVDEFVIYDNIEYTKKGWINRNRILVNNVDKYISLPLKKDSDFLHVKERCLAESWAKENKLLLNRIKESYKKAPYFDLAFQLVESCLNLSDMNLFDFIFRTLIMTNEYLEIKTNIVVSSNIDIDHGLKGEEKVIAICKNRKATKYYNAIGGMQLYSKENFYKEKIELQFLKTNDIRYRQFSQGFVPLLSIIDVMMFNSKEEINGFLKEFTLV